MNATGGIGEPDTGEVGPCPSCGATAYVRMTTNTAPEVRAWWSCAACGTDWAVSVANSPPRPHRDGLAASVEIAAARSVLRQVIALADQAVKLTDTEVHARLLALAGSYSLAGVGEY